MMSREREILYGEKEKLFLLVPKRGRGGGVVGVGEISFFMVYIRERDKHELKIMPLLIANSSMSFLRPSTTF